MNRLIITAGEPAGIGPDLCVMLAHSQRQFSREVQLVIAADPKLLQQRAEQLGKPVTLLTFDLEIREAAPAGALWVLPQPLLQPVEAGILNSDNSGYVLNCLDVAVAECESGTFDALVTGPVHKGVINDAGIAFTGHTEYLAEKTKTPQVVMMLTTKGLRVALVTTHLPLSQVAAAITPELLENVITVLRDDLQKRFGIANPKITVCGLNPHAGEGGHLGREEINTIIPVLEKLRANGFELIGPLPADTAFTPNNIAQSDAMLAMYHDQGLPVLKFKGFGNAANITLGMPIVRTSVDHGTALALAGTGRIDLGSLFTAIEAALEMV